MKFYSNLKRCSFHFIINTRMQSQLILRYQYSREEWEDVSEKNREGHQMPAGIWTWDIRREMELPDHLRPGGEEGTALRGTPEGDGKYHGCGSGLRAERPDRKWHCSAEILWRDPSSCGIFFIRKRGIRGPHSAEHLPLGRDLLQRGQWKSHDPLPAVRPPLNFSIGNFFILKRKKNNLSNK